MKTPAIIGLAAAAVASVYVLSAASGGSSPAAPDAVAAGSSGADEAVSRSSEWVDQLPKLEPGDLIELRREVLQSGGEPGEQKPVGRFQHLGPIPALEVERLGDAFRELADIKLEKAQTEQSELDPADAEALDKNGLDLYRAVASSRMEDAIRSGRYITTRGDTPMIMRDDVYSATTGTMLNGEQVHVTVFVPHSTYTDVQAAHDYWIATRRNLIDGLCEEFNRLDFDARRRLARERRSEESQRYFRKGAAYSEATSTLRRSF